MNNDFFTPEEKEILEEGYKSETLANLKILEGTIVGDKLSPLKQEENLNLLFKTFLNKLSQYISEYNEETQNNIKNFYLYFYLTKQEREEVSKKLYKTMEVYASTIID